MFMQSQSNFADSNDFAIHNVGEWFDLCGYKDPKMTAGAGHYVPRVSLPQD